MVTVWILEGDVCKSLAGKGKCDIGYLLLQSWWIIHVIYCHPFPIIQQSH